MLTKDARAARTRPSLLRSTGGRPDLRRAWLMLAALAVAACGGDSEGPTAPAPEPPESNNAHPSVSVTGPEEGAVVKGTVEVTADASDDGAVASVEFFVDETRIGADDDGSDGWALSWKTILVSDGDHTLRARATDDGGLSAEAERSVLVANIDGSGSPQWARKAFFPGVARDRAVAFSIGDRGYLGLGEAHTVSYADFWEYDPQADAWTQKADFGGEARMLPAAYVVGGKGYVGAGFDGSAHRDDFWEYDPDANTWTQIADFPGGERRSAVGFGIGDRGYVGGGTDNCPIAACSVAGENYFGDLWQYDPSLDAWHRVADIPGELRAHAVAFTIGDRGYVGTGWSAGNTDTFRDFWAYDPATDQWTRIADLVGNGRTWAAAFTVAGKGYVGLGAAGGHGPLFWEYDPAADSWTRMEDWLASPRLAPVAFAVGDRGYLGTGWDGDIYHRDLWEFTPNP